MSCYNLINYNNNLYNIFNDLYNNLDKLKDYNLKYKKYKDYILINYDKSFIDNENTITLGLFRSCLFKHNKLICFSPPKSIKYNNFKQIYEINKCSIEEFIDGTLINLYYDNEPDEFGSAGWKITTKGYIGARNKYFKNYTNEKSFNTMFTETCLELDFDFNLLPKDYCYSFVLQHKENRIVTKFYENSLFLVKCYKINGLNIDLIDSSFLKNNEICKMIKFPQTYSFNNYDDLENKLLSLDFNFKGYYIVNYENCKHTKIRNPNYEYVKNIRGNDVKLQYTYLRLIKEDNLDTYLKYYPEQESLFENYKNDYLEYINNLYNYYISLFIKKEINFTNVNPEYKKNLYMVHGIYLNYKRENLNRSIKLDDITNYFKNLECAQQMYYINYKYHNNLCELNN